MQNTMRLSLGPLLYYWPQQDVLDFYDRIAETPVDIVYLGEIICSKRRLMTQSDWESVAERLEKAGKEVIFSTMALLEAESELSTLRKICANGHYLLEANDLGAVQLLSERGVPFVSGTGINLYNHNSLAKLVSLGLKRWVMPVELSRDTLADMQAKRPEGVETEIFSWGRLPLAYSARCFTARAYNLPKDDCQYRCIDHSDGMTMTTQDDTKLLSLNGIQTQSAQTFSLLGELEDLKRLKVDVLRISPQSQSTEEVINTFHRCLQGELEPREGAASLERLMPAGPCDGYWFGKAGLMEKARLAADTIS